MDIKVNNCNIGMFHIMENVKEIFIGQKFNEFIISKYPLYHMFVCNKKALVISNT